MCNLYTQSKSVDEVARLFREIELPIAFPEGVPNLGPNELSGCRRNLADARLE